MDYNYNSTFGYKLIYIFRINDDSHKGLVKIGDATIYTDNSFDALLPSCKELNLAAKTRIDSYTRTASIDYELLYTEIAVYKKDNKIKAFRDKNVHNVLIRSGIKKHIFNIENNGQEWFETDLHTAINAISAVKKGQASLNPEDTSKDNSPIIFRPEQNEAIKKTISVFKNSDRMLWNAKMRFGKTLCALEVAKRLEFKKTLIFTHRPVVSEGWYEDFGKIFNGTNYIFGSKTNGEPIEKLVDCENPYVYFASIQDLRGSQAVGGKFDKNDYIFLIEWDYIIVDEAHEGTQTTLGQRVLDTILSNNPTKKPKLLELSGTPFNLLTKFKYDEIYTWDYTMEQKAKSSWALTHFGDSNPYEELPTLKIYTYDLDKSIKGFIDIEDSAFNFREFFKVWTGDIKKDFKPVPGNTKVGEFVHKEDVWKFLDLLTKKDDYNNLPFSTDEYRSYYKHTLWIVPGVKEAKALSALMKKHPVFGSGAFEIVNVAGDGDEEENYKDALKAVQNAIGKNPDDHYSITISCGRLTTGVTVPEWTAVLMLAGSFSTSSTSYLQTIFRVQSPANINGKIKETCSVFDFAPDRTLKMVAEAGDVSANVGNVGNDRIVMGEFLNFCPVISINGSSMTNYNVDSLLQQLKRAYTDKVVKNGFDDKNLYNDNLLKLDNVDLEEFEKLKKIIGATKQAKKATDVKMSNNGFTNEEYAELERIEKEPKKERTPEEIAFLEEKKKKKDNAEKAMSILRGISIRIPLMIYGAEIPFNQDVTIENFVNIIDDVSWAEFMPAGVTKEEYKKFSKYYEQDVFVAAGRRIRNMAKSADELPPTERVQKIAEIFSMFRNPDKETVLTPWRVVNMHMSDCLGGYNFFNEDFTDTLDEPIYVDRGKVTEEVFDNPNAKILEINSKTGLYPLYVVYSIFRNKLDKIKDKDLTNDTVWNLWLEIVQNNMFIICKTPMAKSITKRTLLGYKQGKINAHAFDDLINQLKSKPEQFREKILRGIFWDRKEKEMKFDAIVGNPPYQIMDGGAKSSAMPVYNYFVENAKNISSKFVSMIMPSRWMTGGKGLDEFRNDMIHDKHILVLHDYVQAKDVFPSVDIKGGICYFLRDVGIEKKCNVYRHENNEKTLSTRYLVEEGDEIFVRSPELLSIKNKVSAFNEKSFENIVSPRRPYGLSGDIFKDYSKYNLPEMQLSPIRNGLTIYGLDEKLKRIKRFAPIDYPLPKKDYINGYKLFMSRNQGTGLLGEEFSTPVFGKPNDCCTETFVVIGLFNNEYEMNNCWKYVETKFFRAMVGIRKQDQGASKAIYHYVPLQDFTDKSDIDWLKSIPEIDKQLYKKYNLTDEEINFIESSIKPME
jgi:superfamily II DNA or RNA helicase